MVKYEEAEKPEFKQVHGHMTLTVRELLHALIERDMDQPVIVATNDWYLNVVGFQDIHPGEEYALVLHTVDNFDTRQW